MLTKDEKKLIEDTMEIVLTEVGGEEAIKRTARTVSDIMTTWKRAAIYTYSREYYNSYESEDLYWFKFNGNNEKWYCVLWYDGPQIFENAEKTKILIAGVEHRQLEQFTLVHMSSAEYEDRVKEFMNRPIHAMDDLEKDGYKVEYKYIHYRDNDYNVHEWNDTLFDEYPEWFI